MVEIETYSEVFVAMVVPHAKLWVFKVTLGKYLTSNKSWRKYTFSSTNVNFFLIWLTMKYNFLKIKHKLNQGREANSLNP